MVEHFHFWFLRAMYSYDRSEKRIVLAKDGERLRALLTDAWRKLNNLARNIDPRQGIDKGSVVKSIQDSVGDITKITDQLHLPEAQEIIGKYTIPELKAALAEIEKPNVDLIGAQYKVHSAAGYLNQALQRLAANPDLTEKKRQLAHLLKMLVPDASKLNTYEDAFELAESIAAAESGTKKDAFEGLRDSLMAAFRGARQLQTAMVRSPKLLPKI